MLALTEQNELKLKTQIQSAHVRERTENWSTGDLVANDNLIRMYLLLRVHDSAGFHRLQIINVNLLIY